MAPVYENTSTSWSGEPAVRWATVPNGPDSVELMFQSVRKRDNSTAQLTRVTFKDVINYQWTTDAIEFLEYQRGDYEFGLIEIPKSELIAAMVAHRPHAFRPTEADPDFGYPIDGLQHFRIGFDGWGTVDVVCYGVEVDLVEQQTT